MMPAVGLGIWKSSGNNVKDNLGYFVIQSK